MNPDFQPTVYILASRKYGTLYTGVTSNLMQRVYQHREELLDGFTKTHGVKMLVWFEQHGTMDSAITREKRIKKWNRQWRINLIEADNPDWRDLSVDFGLAPAWTLKKRTPPLRHPREGGGPIPIVTTATKTGVGSPPARG